MKGFKVFNPDWTSNYGNTVFEVGKTYHIEGAPELCASGFHFCAELRNCFNYYDFDRDNHVCRVSATGDVAEGDDKACTNELSVECELSWAEVIELMNEGADNIGVENKGDRNLGDRNSGSGNLGNGNVGNGNLGNGNKGFSNAGSNNRGVRNAGDRNQGAGNAGDGNIGKHNAGNGNKGDRNAGKLNVGDRNSGSWNLGTENAGNHNVGDQNAGDWNRGTGCHGCFCTESEKTIRLFDCESDWTMADWEHSRAHDLLEELTESFASAVESAQKFGFRSYCQTKAIPSNTMGHYLQFAQNWWDSLSARDAASILLLPNFDAEKFRLCTGIDVLGRPNDTDCGDVDAGNLEEESCPVPDLEEVSETIAPLPLSDILTEIAQSIDDID